MDPRSPEVDFSALKAHMTVPRSSEVKFLDPRSCGRQFHGFQKQPHGLQTKFQSSRGSSLKFSQSSAIPMHFDSIQWL